MKKIPTPTEEQIKRMKDDWHRIMGDYYDCGPGMEEQVGKINNSISGGYWSDVYMYLCEIGADETALKLTGGVVPEDLH